MLDAILRAAGLRSAAVGNVGLPDRRGGDGPRAVRRVRGRAVQLPAPLHRLDERRVGRGAQRRRGPPRLVRRSRGWPSTPPTRAAIYERVQRACVYNVADPETERLVREADVVEGARAIGFTLGMPAVGMLGVVEDILADRAFVEERETSAAELCTIADLASPAPHFVANALAAAALARAHGVSPGGGARRAARLPPRRAPDRHRRRGRRASPGSTTPRPPTRTPPSRRCRATTRWSGSPAGWPRARGSTTWSRPSRERLRGVVLLGRDRDGHRGRAFATRARCAGHRRRRRRDWSGHGPMERVVEAAARLARPGDTVLLAPGCASMDMFAELRRTRRRLRRRRPAPDGPHGPTGEGAAR